MKIKGSELKTGTVMLTGETVVKVTRDTKYNGKMQITLEKGLIVRQALWNKNGTLFVRSTPE